MQVIDRCKEEGKADGNYHYFTADMANMTSAEALIQVAMYDYIKTFVVFETTHLYPLRVT